MIDEGFAGIPLESAAGYNEQCHNGMEGNMSISKIVTIDEEDDDVIPGGHYQVTAEEGRELFDQRARNLLGISGEEFLRRWDAGEYKPVPDTREGRKIGYLVMMLPFARPTSE
jgi:hypothetical protein